MMKCSMKKYLLLIACVLLLVFTTACAPEMPECNVDQSLQSEDDDLYVTWDSSAWNESTGRPVVTAYIPDDLLSKYYGIQILDDGTAKIVSCYAFMSGDTDFEVTIPEKIDGHQVTAIGSFAFFNCSRLHSVTIPDTVKTIEDNAFKICLDLVEVNIPDSVETIGEKAFSSCIRLADVRLPAGLSTIEKRTFYECRALKHIVIPESVTEIREEAFYESGLTAVKLPENLQKLEYLSLYDGDMHLVILPSNDNNVLVANAIHESSHRTVTLCTDNMTVPDYWEGNSIIDKASLIYSGDYIFSVTDNEALLLSYQGHETDVIVPGTVEDYVVTGVADYAFANLIQLNSVDLPVSVTNIADHAFSGCDNLNLINKPGAASADE